MNRNARGRSGQDYLLGAALALITLALTTATEVGDTFVYVDSIRSFQAGHWATPINPIGEFGHLLWRPLGALLAPVFTALVPDAVAWNARLKIGYGLIFLNEVSAILAAALLFRISRRISGSAAVAALATVGLIWANGFLLYTKAGTDYVLGTAIEICALWVLTNGEAYPGKVKLAAGGTLLGIAALFWTPFAFIVPAAALIPWAVDERPLRASLGPWLTVAATSGAVYFAVLGVGAWVSGVRSPAALHAWIIESSHGWAQTQRALRAVSGFARLLMDLSNDGILMKRFLLKDPYNRETIYDLIRSSLWKIGVFYAFLLALALAAFRSAQGKRMLAVLATALVPMLAFAIFLFEPSSPERFLPVLPFVLLTLAAAWAPPPAGETRIQGHAWAPWAAAALLAAIVPVNASAFIAPGNFEDRLALAQLRDFKSAAAPGDVLISVLGHEPVTALIEQKPFNPVCRGAEVVTAQVFGPVGKTAKWREETARRVLAEWASNKGVWITKWALRDRPPAEMGWVEGDDPAVHWREVPAFFGQFEFDRSTELQEGFERFAHSAKNREMLESAARRDGSPAPGH